jgi:tol-pal system protein YbgF
VRRSPLVLGLALTTGCALKGDVRKVELQVQATRSEVARLDSARTSDRDSLLSALDALSRTLADQQTLLGQIRGDFRTELQAARADIATLQELTGQSQQRLSELRRRFEEPPPAPVDTGRTQAPVATPPGQAGPAVPGPGPGQMYEMSLQQYRRGSLATARLGFQEFLRAYPQHERAPDALFYVGETFAREAPDSAADVYESVVRQYPRSSRAPSALYKLGLLAEQRGDRAAARGYYSRVIAGHPRSDEAALARDKLQRLGQ